MTEKENEKRQQLQLRLHDTPVSRSLFIEDYTPSVEGDDLGPGRRAKGLSAAGSAAQSSRRSNSDGRFKYSSAWSFAKAKTELAGERHWIMYCIGPKPEPPHRLSDEEAARWRPQVPWLGDWTRLRADGMWLMTDEAAQALKQLMAERQGKQEIATAWAQKILSLADRLLEAGGLPLRSVDFIG